MKVKSQGREPGPWDREKDRGWPVWEARGSEWIPWAMGREADGPVPEPLWGTSFEGRRALSKGAAL